MKKEPIKIGWAEADITPGGKCELYGQYYQRVSQGIHSRLSTTVLVINSESEKQAIMISIDLGNFPLEFFNALRERGKRRVPEIIPEKIMMNATHTHSAPAAHYGPIDWLIPDPGTVKTDDNREFVLERLADAVQRVWKNRRSGATLHSRLRRPARTIPGLVLASGYQTGWVGLIKCLGN